MMLLIKKQCALVSGIVIGTRLTGLTANAMKVKMPVTLTPPTAKPHAIVTIIAIGAVQNALGAATQAILAAITPMRRTATKKGIAIGAGHPALGAVIMVRAVMTKLVLPLAMSSGIVIGTRLTMNAMMVQQPVTLTPPTAKPQ